MAVIVHSVPLSAKKFTENDLEVSLKYINPEVYPGLYSKDVLPVGVTYKCRKLMNIADIRLDIPDNFDDLPEQEIEDNILQGGGARVAGIGGNAKNVVASIDAHGFKLSHIPISVAKGPNDKDTLVNGRTRLFKLKAAGFTTVIVDYYHADNWDSFLKMTVMTNGVEDPYSPHTKGDIIYHCNHAIKQGRLKRENNEVLARVQELAPSSFAPTTINKIVNAVLNGDSYTSTCRGFTEATATKWLKDHGYHDNEKGNGIYYKVLSTEFAKKAHTMTALFMQDDLKGLDVKELRIVLHTGTLDAADPEVSWANKIDNFRHRWETYSEAIEKHFFDRPKVKNTIRLYGAIPAVYSLSEKYNMDYLVMFHVGKLKDYTLSEIHGAADFEDALFN
jgi:hypothetical protein